jgi:hypothetical protein
VVVQPRADSEKKFDRGAWLTLFFSIALIVYGFLVLIYRFTLPTDGWRVNEASDQPGENYVKDLMSIPSGLQLGDRAAALNGFPTDWLNVDPSLQGAWQVGATIDYTVIRNGEEIHLPVTLGRWQFQKWLLTILHDPIGLLGLLPGYFLLILSFIVFLRRPGNLAARALLLLFAVFQVNDLLGASILPTSWPEIIDPVANTASILVGLVILSVLMPYAFIRFALVFPHPKPILQRFPWLTHVSLAVGAGIAIFTLRNGSPLGWFWLMLSLVITITIMVHNAFTMRDAVSQAQLRWGLGGLIFGIGLLSLSLIASTADLIRLDPKAFEDFFNLVTAVSGIVMGICLTIAITRYRLFDIDILIRKTLVYSLLTGLLGLVFFGAITLLQSLFSSISKEQSAISIVLSTLTIAALFNPLRKRIQDFIDRRFYRQKYDAEQALAEFAEAARSETDLEQLCAHLTGTVQTTLQPGQVSLWLKEGHQ